MKSVLIIVNRFLQSKYMPMVLCIAAIIMMLPALKTGFMMDDFMQRLPQLKPSQIPAGLYQTGVVPDNPGKLSTVLFETFGFPRDKEKSKIAKNYGLLPWWISDEARVSLWRPFTAFTHWIDYRLYPDSPAIMHAHNIAWFAAVVFLTVIMYRKVIGPSWIAGLAGLMYVLDSNTYFPVMFIANRGFITAICLGLICFYMHYKWRSKKSGFAAVLAVVFLSLSLLANEGGVSTFAFILAYAVVLDEASWPKRLLSLLPAIVTIVVWRIIYQSLGYGTAGVGMAYLDPGHEPLKFLSYFPGYFIAIISGQLSALSPDIMLGMNLHYCSIVLTFYICFFITAIIIFLPVILRNTIARFWFALMIFAAVPIVAAPGGKNFGFVAIGAYGFIAVFMDDLIKNRSLLSAKAFYKYPAWIFCVILLVAHIPLAAVSRITVPRVAPVLLKAFANPKGFKNIPFSADSNVVVINAPCMLSVAVMPINAIRNNQPVPKTIRNLAYAYTALEVSRIDERTLVIKSEQDNIFTSDQRNPLHLAHALPVIDRLFVNSQMFEKKHRFVLDGVTVEILSLDKNNLPKEITFTFDVPLEEEKFCWLQFDWKTFKYQPFNLPKPGEIVMTDGPPVAHLSDALRFLLYGRS